MSEQTTRHLFFKGHVGQSLEIASMFTPMWACTRNSTIKLITNNQRTRYENTISIRKNALLCQVL